MKIPSRIALTLLATSAVTHAVTSLPAYTTITSTNDVVTVYEKTFINIIAPDFAVSGGIGTSALPSLNEVHYYVDILGDTDTSILGVAVSFSDPSASFIKLNTNLGSTTTVLGLATGVYDSSSWSTLSSVPFATAFGNTDNRFIWIAGTMPLTAANDVDGAISLTTLNSHAARSGTAASNFVALGSGGTILSGSLIPEPSSSMLLVIGACGTILHRRRTRC